jgi:hypothetical protein
VFYITGENIYKTSECIYHNVGNGKLKLFSFGSFTPKKENTQFTKRVRSVFPKMPTKKGRGRKTPPLYPELVEGHC